MKQSGNMCVRAPIVSRKLETLEKFEVKIFSDRASWVEYF